METTAKIKNKLVRIAALVLILFVLKLLFAVSDTFAQFYFHRWYVWISAILRSLSQFIPISLGDLLYIGWGIGLLVYLLRIVIRLLRFNWTEAGLATLGLLRFTLSLYLAFLVLWGYNYRRPSLAEDLGLEVGPYETRDLYQLADTLLQEVNRHKVLLGDTLSATKMDSSSREVFNSAIAAYGIVAKQWPALRYRYPVVKPSLFGERLNYLGVTGYLNPFTNEAQVNTTTPGFLLPFTTCHEIAHQLGYAPEEAANFIGYLAATHTPDIRFRYAANYEMFLYSVGQLARQDTVLASQLWKQVLPGVKKDYEVVKRFYARYKGPADKLAYLFYDQYLKANQQEKGIHSYSEVTGWLIAYFRKQRQVPAR